MPASIDQQDPPHDAFEQTVRAAVASTSVQARAELADLRAALRAWETQLDGLDVSTLVDSQGKPLDSAAAVVRRALRILSRKAGRRAKHLDAFNVVLFGRTGAGKSSFVEALSRGDGRRISELGQLDKTRDVETRAWRGFAIVDTPGIQGWAESDERRRIERLAQEAVERADVVVLAFDSLNQKVGEFRQVAEWVSNSGKAAVALLNIKNDIWRFDEWFLPGDTREAAASQVRGHAEHVRRMLDEIGLPNVPLVALNTQWAFGARSKRPKAHPALDDIQDAIALVGTGRLEHVSNLAAVTDLLRTAVELDPETLRLGGVRTEIDAVLSRFLRDLSKQQDAVEAQLEVGGDQLKAGLDRTGFEPRPSAARFRDEGELGLLRGLVAHVDAIWATDDPRRRRPKRAAIEHKLDQALRPALSVLRNDAFARAQRAIGGAFTKRTAVDGATIAQRTLTAEQVRNAVAPVVTKVFSDLGEDLLQDAEDAAVALDVTLSEMDSGFDAQAGAAARWQGRVAGFASAGALTFGLASIASGGAAFVVVGLVGGFFARRRRKQAEQQLRNERTRAERNIGIWLDGALERTRRDVVETTKQAALVLGARALSPLAENLATLSRQRNALTEVALAVSAYQAGLTTDVRAQDVITRAKSSVESQRHAGDASAPDKIWLGEDWLDAPLATERLDAVPLVLPPGGHDLALPSVDADAVCSWLDRCAATASRGIAGELERARSMLIEAPEVVLLGDYSAGKTSLIRRIGAELQLTTTDDLAVGAAPTTSSVIRIHTPSFILVDTPGLESERREDEAKARAALSDGAVLVLLHSAASGDLSKILEVVRPSHVPERARRVVHVLARSDALAARPHRDGRGFVKLLDAKLDELRDRLLGVGLPCPASLPLPVAADPGGRHQDAEHWEIDDFDFNRGWDGIGPLLRVLTRLAPDGRPAAAVDRVLTCLDAERTARLAHIADLEAGQREVKALRRLYQRALEDLRRVERHAASSLRTLVESLIAERTNDLAEADTSTLKEIAANAQMWFLSERLAERLDTWTDGVDAQVRAAYVDLSEAVQARTRKPSFDAVKDRTGAGDPLRDLLEETSANVGKLPALLGQVPRVAEQLGKLGPTAGRALGSVAAVVLEGAAQALEGAAAKRHDQKLEATIKALRIAGAQWVDDVLAGADGHPGLLDAVRAERYTLVERPLADRDVLISRTTARIEQDQLVCADIETMIHEGRGLLAR